ncbi:ADP-ribosylglycohydrolase family protein [Ruania alba]|uniref:ADP-ribosylglycohydrolase n=1 Tax=Ruania alba TaxID=648782 RepID=A0A1H5MH73_9MICO|nr:ADP-ribosylglycohydrolase family protein [Ruania alba]SEE88057.1 ADP-ribosylglycohydrolase [Ruania alba]
MVSITAAGAAVHDRTCGALLGLALGDSMGRAGRGWTQDQVRHQLGWVSGLLPGNSGGQAGTVGSGTRAVLQMASGWPHRGRTDPVAARDAPLDATDVLEDTVPSSAVLRRTATRAVDASSGLAQRAVPIGIAFNETRSIAARVAEVAGPGTTSTALAAAGLVGGLISSALDAPTGAEDPVFLAAHLEMGFRSAEATAGYGAEDAVPSVIESALLARDIAVRAPDDAVFLQRLYDVVGVSALCTEAVPAAVGILFRAGGHPARTCVLAANLGGETSRIGALATAMAGAVLGRDAIPAELSQQLEQVNHLRIADLAVQLVQLRG